MRIFLAGPGTMREELGRLIREELPRLGCSAYDWTADPGWDDPAQHDPVKHAKDDIREVYAADAVIWLISRDHPSHGAPFEAGVAYALAKPVIIWALPLPPSAIYGHLLAYEDRYRSSSLARCVEIAREMVAASEVTR